MSTSSLLSRLLLWHKFVILSVVALLLASIPTYFYVHETNKVIDAAILEGEGMQPVANMLKVVQLTQQHRGLSALVLGGIESAKDKLDAKQSEANKAYDLMAANIKAIHDPAIDAAWNAARPDWDTLRAAVASRSLTVPQSYAAHTALVPKLLVVNDLVADYYGLSLDPDVDTYQLIQSMYYQLPYLTEELGKMRAKGAGLLAKKEATPDERMVVSGIISRVNDRLGQVSTSFGKAIAVNPLMKEKLAGSVQEASKLAAEVVKLANDQIVNATTLDYSSVDYVAATTQAIDAQVHVTDLANHLLQDIQTEKIADFHHTRWTMVFAMLALIGIAGFIQYFIAHSVSAPLGEAITIAQRVAAGDLTSHFDTSATNETGRLLQALKDMNDGLIKIVSEVRLSVDNIGDACGDIASGNADLSARTESQAASLEETASSMEEITSTVKQNADNAHQANQLVVNASDVAIKGGKVVAEVVQTMEEINDSSRKIVDIIAVIDGIAFQTNILALNAAVEAARAGEQGRGFAVVAAEVRNLAQRSASAAKEIKELIGASVEKVGVGNKLVGQAGHSMDEIVASIKRVTNIMSDIAMASKEQTGGIEQVNLAITQMDEVTQQNAALVEQAAAAAESLNDQAKGLMDTVSVFDLGTAAAPARARAPASPRPVAIGRKATPVLARPAIMHKRNSTVAVSGTQDDWEEM